MSLYHLEILENLLHPTKIDDIYQILFQPSTRFGAGPACTAQPHPTESLFEN
jgi:hypothetical protein